MTVSHDTLAPASDQDQARARDAALGPASGPCCTPHEAPCITCLVPDDVPYEPSEADEADYLAWCRERDARLWDERIAAEEDRAYRDMRRAEADARLAAAVFAAIRLGDFRKMLGELSDAFHDHESPDVAWVGGKMASLYDRACHLEATSGEIFNDREDAMLDAVLAAHAMR